VVEEKRTRFVKSEQPDREGELFGGAALHAGSAMVDSMLRQMFSSKAWQCIKGEARGNLHPRTATIESRMRPLLRKTFLRFAALALGCVIVAGGIASPGFAKDPFPADQPAPPPEGVPMKIEVPRGRAVLITLSAYSLTSPITRFKIRRTAQAGKLGTPHMVSASTAQVRYEPPAGAGPGEDSFVFAVVSDAGVSAPAEVTINITDTEPLFVAPTDVEFGQVLAGGRVRKTIDLQNLGGGMAEGTVKVPDGWTVEGDPDYHLGAGAKESFTLVFAPPDQRAYTGDIEYTGNHERATDLNGEGVGPLAVITGTVELTQAGSLRSGTIHILNRTAQALPVKLTPGESVHVASSATVPGNGAVDIPVQAGLAGGIDDTVTVEGTGLKMAVTVHADGNAPPPMPDMAAAHAVSTPPPAGQPPAQRPASPTEMTQVANTTQAPLTAMDDSSLPPLTLPPADSGDQYVGPEPFQMASLQIGSVGRKEAEVGCDFKGQAQARSYRLELQTIGIDAQGRPISKWIPFPGASLTTNAQAVTAQMSDLLQGALYVVRIVGLDDQGGMIEFSSVGSIMTPLPGPPWWKRWQVQLTGALLLGAGSWWWRKKKMRRWG
jgi:hypothetical protein